MHALITCEIMRSRDAQWSTGKHWPWIKSEVWLGEHRKRSAAAVGLDFVLGLWRLECFSVESRKTKTKVITHANHKEHAQYSEPIKTRSNYR